MAAHPQHSKEDAAKMAEYILSFADEQKSLPPSGAITFNRSVHEKSNGNYILRAIYTDKGGPVVGTMTGSKMLVLRNQKVEAEDFILDGKMNKFTPDGTTMTVVGEIRNGAFMKLPGVDLTGISKLQIDVVSMQKGTTLEVHVDSPTGEIVAQSEIPLTGQDKPTIGHLNINMKSSEGKHDVFVVFKNNSGVLENIAFIDWIRFNK
jgi:cytochrome c